MQTTIDETNERNDDGPAEPEPFRMAGIWKQVLIYGAGMALGKVVGFLMLPVYTRYLTPADYGIMELVSMTLDVISIVAGAQIALGIFRYYHKTDVPEEKEAVVSTALLALALSYTLVGVATFVMAEWLAEMVFRTGEHARLIRIAAVTLPFQSLLIVPLSYARMRERSVLFVAANVVRMVLGLGLNVLFLVGMGLGVEAIFYSNLIASVVVGSWMAGLVLREVGVRFTRQATRDLLRYGVPMIGTQVATFITTFGDRFFLQARADETTVGLYTLAYQFGFLLAMVGYMPFETVWEPKRFEIARREDRDEIYARGFVYLNVLLITAALGFSLFVGDVLRIMTTPAFHPAAAIVPVILIAYVLQGWTGLQDIGILVRERTEFVTLGNWLAALVALGGYAILVPRYLAWGAAVATVAAFAVRHFTIFFISQRLWPVRYRWGPVLRLVCAAGVAAGAGILLPELSIRVSLAIRAGLFAAYLLAAWHLAVLTSGEKVALRRLLGRVSATARALVGPRAPDAVANRSFSERHSPTH